MIFCHYDFFLLENLSIFFRELLTLLTRKYPFVTCVCVCVYLVIIVHGHRVARTRSSYLFTKLIFRFIFRPTRVFSFGITNNNFSTSCFGPVPLNSFNSLLFNNYRLCCRYRISRRSSVCISKNIYCSTIWVAHLYCCLWPAQTGYKCRILRRARAT